MATSNPGPNSRGLVVSPPTLDEAKEAMESGMFFSSQTPLTPTSPISPTTESSFTGSPPGSPPFGTRVSMSPNRTTALRSAASAIAVSSNRPPANRQGAPNSFSPSSPSQGPARGRPIEILPRTEENAPSLSPASSMIFERSVQSQQPMTDSTWSLVTNEDDREHIDHAAPFGSSIHTNMASKIPTHMLTEDHIPPVLEASTRAIARGEDPEKVEIITHASHQSVGESINSVVPSIHASYASTLPSAMQNLQQNVREHVLVPTFVPPRPLSPIQMLHQPLLEGIGEEKEDDGTLGQGSNKTKTTTTASSPMVVEALTARSYGSRALENHGASSPRRLSFVSFADVVHGEQSIMPVGSLAHGGTSPPSSTSSPVSSPRGVLKPSSPPFTSAPGSGGGSPSFPPVGTSPSGTVVGDLVYSKMSSAMRLPGRESMEF